MTLPLLFQRSGMSIEQFPGGLVPPRGAVLHPVLVPVAVGAVLLGVLRPGRRLLEDAQARFQDRLVILGFLMSCLGWHIMHVGLILSFGYMISGGVMFASSER